MTYVPAYARGTRFRKQIVKLGMGSIVEYGAAMSTLPPPTKQVSSSARTRGGARSYRAPYRPFGDGEIDCATSPDDPVCQELHPVTPLTPAETASIEMDQPTASTSSPSTTAPYVSRPTSPTVAASASAADATAGSSTTTLLMFAGIAIGAIYFFGGKKKRR